MATFIVEPGQMYEPEKLLSPAEDSTDGKYEKYKSDGVYEYSLKPNGKLNKSHVKISYNEGDIFEGRISFGKYVGYGKYAWKNGGIYEGNFSRGKLSGKGKYTEANGDVYEGDFKNNKYNGNGKYSWADGSTFDGKFKNGKLVSGRYTDAEGNVYSCNFKYKLNGDRKSSNMKLIKKATYKQEEKHEEKSAEVKAKAKQKPKQTKSGLLSKDTKLLTTIRGSKRGPEFKNLYSGASGKSEKSERDLIAILNFFTNSNAEQMQRIFKSSKIYDESKGQEYLTEMINNTIKGGKQFTEDLKARNRSKQRTNAATANAARAGASR